MALRFLQNVKDKQARLQATRVKRAHKAEQYKKARIMWHNQTTPHNYGAFTDIRRLNQCLSCTATQRRSVISEAKIQSFFRNHLTEEHHHSITSGQIQTSKL